MHQCMPEGIATSLQVCAADLARWNKSTFGHVSKQIQNKRKALNALVLQDRNGSMGKEINRFRREINDLLDCEETCIRGQEYYGMAKGIATQSFSIPKLFRGERKIQLVAFGMRMGTDEIQMRALQ